MKSKRKQWAEEWRAAGKPARTPKIEGPVRTMRLDSRVFMDGYKTSTSPRGSADAWRQALADRMGLDEAKRRVGKETPESILGVAVGATWAEVKSAYKRLALVCHPDRAVLNGLTVEEATEWFKRLVAAYTVLEARRGK